MACEFICDGCGKRAPGFYNGRDWFKPHSWFERSDADGPQTVCSRGCIGKVAEKTGQNEFGTSDMTTAEFVRSLHDMADGWEALDNSYLGDVAVQELREKLSLADHLESEPSGGLREAAQQACDYYFQENGQSAYVMGKHDENMRSLRSALATAPRKEQS